MSVIAAARHGGKTVVCTDGRAVLDSQLMSDSMRKIAMSPGKTVIVGAVGDLAETQRFVQGFENGTIKIVKKRGSTTISDPDSPVGNSMELVATKDDILTMDAAGGMVKHGNIAAIGDGAAVATGALAMAFKQGLHKKVPLKKLVEDAVRVACDRLVTCGGKLTTYELG